MSANPIDRDRLRRTCVVLLFVVISAIFLRMIWSFVLPVVMAAIFAGLAYPMYQRLLGVFRGRTSPAAAVSLLLIILIVVTPLIFVASMVASQGAAISQSLDPWVQEHLSHSGSEGGSLEWIPFWDKIAPHQDQITAKLGEIATAVSSFLVASLSAATRGTVSFFFDLFIMLYAMFFFLMHGRGVLEQVMRLLPLEDADKAMLLGKFVSVARATLKGTFIIGIIQGALGGVAFAAVGIAGAAFWGTVMAVLSVIPGVGTAIVWAPAVVYLFAIGRPGPAIFLLLWCAVVVGLADNFLRPLLVGKDTEMPDLMVMLSTFGGLALFGAVGIVIGPIIAALFMAVWRIYGQTFGELLSTPEACDDPG